MKQGKQCMPHREEGLPFNACLYFLKDFKPPLKSCILNSCGSRISQLFQGMQCVFTLCLTPDLQHLRLGRDPIPNSTVFLLFWTLCIFFLRDLSVGPKQSMYHLHPSVKKTADPALSALHTMYTEQPG